MKLEGVWLPIITPFRNGPIDYEAYAQLIDYFISKGISGLIPLGTTGESPTVSETEVEELVDKTMSVVDRRIPVFAGVGGNHTAKVLKMLKVVAQYEVDGVLSVCPYYNRPDQNGLCAHFMALAETSDLDIIIYNIPYRTGVNLENETLLRLAEQKNIVAVKDSCGQIKQSLALLAQKPDGFSILTGEDHLYYTTLVNGGDGGILASAHLNTAAFVHVYEMVKNNDHQAALQKWQSLAALIPLLFEEPNPGPVKYCLEILEQLPSGQTRLPLTPISEELKAKLRMALGV